MSAPTRVSFPYAEDTELAPPESTAKPTGPKQYPDVPQVYPGRPFFCTGCCVYADMQFKQLGDGSQFRPRPPIHGEANCERCRSREQERRGQP